MPDTLAARTCVSRLEAWAILLCCVALCVIAGHGVQPSGRADWDALAAVSHAFDVVYKEPRFNLSLIGFVDPPLPALLYLPFCGFIPTSATSGLACPILGCLLLGGTALLLNSLLAYAGLPRSLRRLLILGFISHPLILSFTVLGSPGILLAFAVTGAAWALTRWSQEENFRDLVTASLFVTAAVLTRYEAVWFALTATGYVAWRTHRKNEGWARTEGTLIAFLLPVVYCATVWVGANWAILGDPWHFWRETTAAGPETSMAWQPWVSSVLWALIVVCPPILGLLYHEVRGVGRRAPIGRPAAWLAIGTMLGAIITPRLHLSLNADPWLRLATLSVAGAAIGCALLGVVVAHYLQHGLRGSRFPLTGTVVLAVLGVALVLHGQAAGRAGLPTSVLQTVSGQVAFASDVHAERNVAQIVASKLGPDAKAYVVGGPGFAVSLFAARPAQMVLHETADFGRLPLREGDLLLVHEGPGAGHIPDALKPRGLSAEPVPIEDAGAWDLLEISRAGADPDTVGH